MEVGVAELDEDVGGGRIDGEGAIEDYDGMPRMSLGDEDRAEMQVRVEVFGIAGQDLTKEFHGRRPSPCIFEPNRFRQELAYVHDDPPNRCAGKG
jgi:hypothetical protein